MSMQILYDYSKQLICLFQVSEVLLSPAKELNIALQVLSIQPCHVQLVNVPSYLV